jgi:GH15 family glucan-1,4-alpha-glucosidase
MTIKYDRRGVIVAGGYPPIGDYALIGDCRGAGLVSRDGSLDWLCLPRFDSPPIFAAMLDAESGGRFRIRPRGTFRAERRYLPDTAIVETIFRGPDGAVAVRDCMTVAAEEEKRARLTPDHEVLREIEGLSGEVELEVVYDPRPDFGRVLPRLERRGALGVWWQDTRAVLVFQHDLPIEAVSATQGFRGVARIRAGERRYCSLTYDEEGPATVPPLGAAARARMERSERWWRDWTSHCIYAGPYRDAVVRSAITLKLMTYAPSGAIVAAPTTSLPERVGGARNWDYRYCWLRDASLTLRALFTLGYDEEAIAFLSWMLHATRLTQPELQVVYSVFGEARLTERELPHLAGYCGSRPVRTGNDAHGQLQLDVYGEVIDAAARFADRGGTFDRDTRRLLDGFGRTVCRRWQEPDEGIWEQRGGRKHHTYSKVLCWVALDRLIAMHEAGQGRFSVGLFRHHRGRIRAAIEARGYSERLQSYTSTFDGDALDAALLALPLYGYIDARHPRMRSTYARIEKTLGSGSLRFRYDARTADGFDPGEGAFALCGFWAVECLARGGEVERATDVFEALLGYGNDLGLFAEQIDPESGAALGNFPQAFTHVGLINAAVTLAACRDGGEPEPIGTSRVAGSTEG